jgi:hypothetical protein
MPARSRSPHVVKFGPVGIEQAVHDLAQGAGDDGGIPVLGLLVTLAATAFASNSVRGIDMAISSGISQG